MMKKALQKCMNYGKWLDLKWSSQKMLDAVRMKNVKMQVRNLHKLKAVK